MAKASDNNGPLADHFIDGLNQPCVVLTLDGELLQWNKKMREVTGHSDEDLACMHISDLLPAEERGFIEEQMQTAVEKGEVTTQIHFITKDDRTASYEFRAVLQQEGDRKVLYATGLEIGGRDTSGQASRRVSERAYQVLQQLPVYLFVHDRELCYTWMSSGPPGKDVQDYVGNTDWDIYPEEEARSLHAVKRWVLESGRPSRVEVAASFQGKRRYFDTYLSPRESETGEVKGLVGAAVDITARRQAEEGRLDSEQRYRELFEVARDGIAIHTPDDQIIDINPAGLEILGYSREELEQLDAADVYPDPGQAERVTKILDEEGEVHNLEVTLRRKDGEEVVCLLSSTARENEADGTEQYYTIFRDISERKQYQDQFRLLVEEVKDYAIFMLDREGQIVTWNEGAEKIKGYDREEVVGKHLAMFYSKEDREAGNPDRLMAQAVREGRVEDEGWRVRRDGSRFWARATLTALHDEQGRLRGFAKVTRDLTEQREREKALRESEERYRRLFEESQEGIAISTPEGQLVDANSAAEEIFGYRVEEVKQMHLRQLYVYPEERQKVLSVLTEQGAIRNFEAHFYRKDGEVIICQLSSTARRGPEGEIEAFQTFFRDITAQKRAQEALEESEEKFRRLFEESRDAIILTTSEGDITDVNSSAEQLFGYSRDEFIDLHAKELYARPEERTERIVPALLESNSSRVLEAWMRHKEGHEFLASASVTVHRNEDEEPDLIQALVRDITQKRRLEEQLLEIQEAERRRIGQELHDGIASQLTGVTMIGEGLASDVAQGKEVTEADLNELTELVRESAQQTRLLSRGLNPVQVGKEGLPAALGQLAERTEKQSGLSCQFAAEGRVPKLDEQRAAHLYRIAQEAVSNAVKHAEASLIQVRLSAAERTVTLSVADDGKGLPEKVRDGSDGLGLHTMRYRADLIGGRLEVTDRPRDGTLVCCELSRE